MRFVQKTRSIICFMACVAGSLLFFTSNQVQGQVIYTITGFANNGGIGGDSPQVGAEERYTAVFEIDDSVVDTDPTEQFGRYPGAIISSSITFEGGYTSTVDFSGGEVTIRTDESGGGVFFDSADGGDSGNFLVFSFVPFETDALLVTPQEITNLPGSLWSLQEPDGAIVSFALPGDSPAVESLEVSLPEIVLGDCNQDGDVDYQDIKPFIETLLAEDFLAEADINQSGVVSFLDISPFIQILLGSEPNSGY